MAPKVQDLRREVIIDLCKDGTITYRLAGQKTFNGAALPVFSVDTLEQAKLLQATFGKLQYRNHPLQPERPWYKWSGFNGELESLDQVTAMCRAFYAQVQGG